jgi:hypothetical protein
VPGSTGFDGTKIGGNPTHTASLIINDGSIGTGGIHSFGASSGAAQADRALGAIASSTISNSHVMAFGFALRNNVAGAVITSITISFNQENWRTPTTANNTLTAAWGTSATAGVTENNYLSAAGMTLLPSLNMTLAFTAANTALDGNLLANQVPKTFTFSAVNLGLGDRLFVRWQDADDPGGTANDAGIGMDDMTLSFVVSVVPEATAAAFGAMATGGAGLIWMLRRLRRRLSRAPREPALTL